MKKIISLVCVIAMLFAFAVTANAAADNEVTLTIKEQTADATVLSLSMNTTHTVASFQFYLDFSDATAKGASVVAAPVNAGKAQYNAQQKMVLVTFAPTDGTTYTGSIELATITLTNVTAEIAIDKKAESSRTKTEVTAKDPNGGSDLTVTADFAYAPALTVAPFAPAFTPETIKGAVVEGTDDIVLEKDPATSYTNTYLGTAVFSATLGADVKYSEAGFIFVKGGVEGTPYFKAVDAEEKVIAGTGTFEYAVAMYGIEDGVDIDAVPYYITAE